MQRKLISSLVLFTFLFNMACAYGASAQTIAPYGLPQPGMLLNASKIYSYPVLKGVRIDPNNPTYLEFIIDAKDRGNIDRQELSRLVSYFLACLTIPENDLWVNLSPYEQNRITSEKLAQTDLGKDMLGQDYVLKQLASSLTYPETELGKKYWQSANGVGANNHSPANNFQKVWIVPAKALIYEHNGTAVIKESGLKAMTDTDYLAAQKNSELPPTPSLTKRGSEQSDTFRKNILPLIEKEINTGENFARLRQIHNAFLLASWFKKKLKDSAYKYYIDQGKVKGIDLKDKNVKENIYNLYVEAFKKGAYNYVKKEFVGANNYLPVQKISKRQYFSGGIELKDNADRKDDPSVEKIPADAGVEILLQGPSTDTLRPETFVEGDANRIPDFSDPALKVVYGQLFELRGQTATTFYFYGKVRAVLKDSSLSDEKIVAMLQAINDHQDSGLFVVDTELSHEVEGGDVDDPAIYVGERGKETRILSASARTLYEYNLAQLKIERRNSSVLSKPPAWSDFELDTAVEAINALPGGLLTITKTRSGQTSIFTYGVSYLSALSIGSGELDGPYEGGNDALKQTDVSITGEEEFAVPQDIKDKWFELARELPGEQKWFRNHVATFRVLELPFDDPRLAGINAWHHFNSATDEMLIVVNQKLPLEVKKAAIARHEPRETEWQLTLRDRKDRPGGDIELAKFLRQPGVTINRIAHTLTSVEERIGQKELIPYDRWQLGQLRSDPARLRRLLQENDRTQQYAWVKYFLDDSLSKSNVERIKAYDAMFYAALESLMHELGLVAVNADDSDSKSVGASVTADDISVHQSVVTGAMKGIDATARQIRYAILPPNLSPEAKKTYLALLGLLQKSPENRIAYDTAELHNRLRINVEDKVIAEINNNPQAQITLDKRSTLGWPLITVTTKIDWKITHMPFAGQVALPVNVPNVPSGLSPFAQRVYIRILEQLQQRSAQEAGVSFHDMAYWDFGGGTGPGFSYACPLVAEALEAINDDPQSQLIIDLSDMRNLFTESYRPLVSTTLDWRRLNIPLAAPMDLSRDQAQALVDQYDDKPLSGEYTTPDSRYGKGEPTLWQAIQKVAAGAESATYYAQQERYMVHNLRRNIAGGYSFKIERAWWQPQKGGDSYWRYSSDRRIDFDDPAVEQGPIAALKQTNVPKTGSMAVKIDKTIKAKWREMPSQIPERNVVIDNLRYTRKVVTATKDAPLPQGINAWHELDKNTRILLIVVRDNLSPEVFKHAVYTHEPLEAEKQVIIDARVVANDTILKAFLLMPGVDKSRIAHAWQSAIERAGKDKLIAYDLEQINEIVAEAKYGNSQRLIDMLTEDRILQHAWVEYLMGRNGRILREQVEAYEWMYFRALRNAAIAEKIAVPDVIDEERARQIAERILNKSFLKEKGFTGEGDASIGQLPLWRVIQQWFNINDNVESMHYTEGGKRITLMPASFSPSNIELGSTMKLQYSSLESSWSPVKGETVDIRDGRPTMVLAGAMREPGVPQAGDTVDGGVALTSKTADIRTEGDFKVKMPQAVAKEFEMSDGVGFRIVFIGNK